MKLVREHINEEERPFKYFKGKSIQEIEKNLKSSNMSLLEIFYKAVINNLPNLVQKCIDKGINPSIKYESKFGYTNTDWAIKTACLYGYLGIVKILANDPRVDITNNSNTPIFNAFYNHHYDIVKYLLKFKKVKESLSDKQLREINSKLKLL